jgi:hypothetical protein
MADNKPSPLQSLSGILIAAIMFMILVSIPPMILMDGILKGLR